MSAAAAPAAPPSDPELLRLLAHLAESVAGVRARLGRAQAAGADREGCDGCDDLSPLRARLGPREQPSRCDADVDDHEGGGGGCGGSLVVEPDGTVREPASGAFDVTMVPGEDAQVAVDRCPPGGCVLLLPGRHDGPLVLSAEKKVHVFGRGRATLRTAEGTVLYSSASVSTVDGLILRREAGGGSSDCCVWVGGGRLRLQACDITSASLACVAFSGGADPILASCKCVRSCVGRLHREATPPGRLPLKLRC